MDRPLSTSRELRWALVPWIATCAVAGIALYLLAILTLPTPIKDAAIAIASSLLSVAIALLITELALKPIYVRDILGVAELKSELYNTGLESVKRMTQSNFADVYHGCYAFDVAGTPEQVQQVWPAALEAAHFARSDVHLHLPKVTNATTYTSFERSWKERGLEKRGARLTVSLSMESDAPLLATLTPSSCIVAVSDGSTSAGNPLILHFSRRMQSPYILAICSYLDDLRECEEAPVYQTKISKSEA